MEKIIEIDRVTYEEALQKVQEEKHPTQNKTKEANCIGQSLGRKCLLKHVIERQKG